MKPPFVGRAGGNTSSFDGQITALGTGVEAVQEISHPLAGVPGSSESEGEEKEE